MKKKYRLLSTTLKTVFALVSASSFFVGLTAVQHDQSSIAACMWMIVHGVLCSLYSFSMFLLNCIAVPAKKAKLDEEYDILRTKIDYELQCLNLQPLQVRNRVDLVKEEDYSESNHRKNVFIVMFGVIFILSLISGIFFTSTFQGSHGLRIYLCFLLSFSAVAVAAAAALAAAAS